MVFVSKHGISKPYEYLKVIFFNDFKRYACR